MAAPVECNLVTKEFESLYKGIDAWTKKNSTRALFNDPHEAALKLVNSNFNIDLNHLRYIKDLTPGQVKGFLARLNELSGKIGEGDLGNYWAKLFWQTSHYGPKDPVIGNLLNKMQKSQFKLRANEVSDRSDIKYIYGELELESLDRGFERRGFSNTDKEIQKLDERRTEAIADYKNAEAKADLAARKAAENRVLDVNREMDEMIAETHLSVYDEMIKVIEIGIPQALNDKYQILKNKAFDENGKVINKKAANEVEEYRTHERVLKLDENEIGTLVKRPDGSSLLGTPHLYNALVKYQSLMEGLYGTLRLGVDQRIDSIIKRMKHLNKLDKNDENAIKSVRDRMEAKYMPRYEEGFFPHYVRDMNAEFMDGMMEHFDNLQRVGNSHDKKQKKTIKEVIEGMNLYINKHADPRSKDTETGRFGYNYSRNFLNSVRNYISDVNRFNYISFMDGHMLESLTSVERIFKTDGAAKGYAQNLVDFITDMHSATNGDASISPKTRAWMRTLLGFEFISKLGVNPRAAARNWFQRLLDYVTWSPVQVKKSKEYLKTIDLGKEGVSAEDHITSVLKKNGLLYEEVSPEFLESQLQAPASVFKLIEWNNETNKFEAVKKSRMERVADGISVAAGKASWLHRKAENSNRKHTFRLGYSQMHRWLSTPEFKNPLADAGKTPAQIKARIKAAAENYAIRMVVMNHFDYADYAKSKALRSKVGKFAFQFQHFMFEFFERNMKILRESKYDILAGKLTSNPFSQAIKGGDASGLAQAYRMSFLYFLAPMLASVYSGVDFTNLVEHDTAQRLKQWATFFLGDDEEVAAAFYGKGPLISTFGGPITSDAIDIGVMLDLIDLDDDSIFTLIAGLESYDPYQSSTDVTRSIRILNTFAGRAFERHIPLIKTGKPGWAFQQEFGLYPTAEARKAQKRAQRLRKQILPADLERALKKLGQQV